MAAPIIHVAGFRVLSVDSDWTLEHRVLVLFSDGTARLGTLKVAHPPGRISAWRWDCLPGGGREKGFALAADGDLFAAVRDAGADLT